MSYCLRLNLLLSILFIPIFVSSLAFARPIIIPGDLNSGDNYVLVFVTKSDTDATSDDIAFYNTFVTNQANASPELAALGTTWMAIASTLSVVAINNIGLPPDVPIYRLDGGRVADDSTDLWDGSIIRSISYDQYGDVLEEPIWTGTNSDGTDAAHETLGASFGQSVPGESWHTDAGWIRRTDDYLLPMSFSIPHLYGMSGVLAVPPSPRTSHHAHTWHWPRRCCRCCEEKKEESGLIGFLKIQERQGQKRPCFFVSKLRMSANILSFQSIKKSQDVQCIC